MAQLSRWSPRPQHVGAAAGAVDFRHLLVKIVCANGLAVPAAADDAGVFCSCTIMGKAGSRLVTRRLQSDVPVWNHEVAVTNFAAGDALLFGVWHGDWQPMGSAVLEHAQIQETFDGYIPLMEARRNGAPNASLRVRVSDVTKEKQDGANADDLEDEAHLGRPEGVAGRPPAPQHVRPQRPGANFQGNDTLRLQPQQPPQPQPQQQQQQPPQQPLPQQPQQPRQQILHALHAQQWRTVPQPQQVQQLQQLKQPQEGGGSPALARPSPAWPLLRPPGRPPGVTGDPPGLAVCGTGPAPSTSLEDQEDIDWTNRQQTTGCVGRLVPYERWDCPQADFLLRGGSGRRVYVAQVTDGGRAQRLGVKAGDVLVSIDGRKDFMLQPSELLHATISPPVTLVFMGFVGRPTAEVQLAIRSAPCGAPASTSMLGAMSQGSSTLLDQITFQASKPSTVMLATMSPPHPVCADMGTLRRDGEPENERERERGRSQSPAVFELGRDDAVSVVRGALSPITIADALRSRGRRPGAPLMPAVHTDSVATVRSPSSPSASRRPPSSAVRVVAPPRVDLHDALSPRCHAVPPPPPGLAGAPGDCASPASLAGSVGGPPPPLLPPRSLALRAAQAFHDHGALSPRLPEPELHYAGGGAGGVAGRPGGSVGLGSAPRSPGGHKDPFLEVHHGGMVAQAMDFDRLMSAAAGSLSPPSTFSQLSPASARRLESFHSPQRVRATVPRASPMADRARRKLSPEARRHPSTTRSSRSTETEGKFVWV